MNFELLFLFLINLIFLNFLKILYYKKIYFIFCCYFRFALAFFPLGRHAIRNCGCGLSLLSTLNRWQLRNVLKFSGPLEHMNILVNSHMTTPLPVGILKVKKAKKNGDLELGFVDPTLSIIV